MVDITSLQAISFKHALTCTSCKHVHEEDIYTIPANTKAIRIEHKCIKCGRFSIRELARVNNSDN